MTIAALRLQVRAIGSQLEALDAQLAAMEEPDEHEEHAACPRCGGREFASGGDIDVCAGCNANLRDGELVDG
jgi:hypothetical protein